MRRFHRRSALLAWCVAVSCGAHLAAQTAPAATGSPPIAIQPSGQSATFTFFNRPIVVLRAQVLGRGPVERAESATRVLDDLIAQGNTGPVESHPFNGGWLITVASRGVLGLTSPDIDELSGESVESAAGQAVERLRQALDEAAEARSLGAFLRSAAGAAAVVGLSLLALWGITRARRAVGHRLDAIAERTIARARIADVDVVLASRLPLVERWIVRGLAVILDLIVVYAAVGFVLRRFPYTRPWGESMRGFLLTAAMNMGLGIANTFPGLFTIVIIYGIARFASRLIRLWFDAVERGHLTPRWIYPETAQPTRRLLILLLWAFALVVAYPYVPGSQTEAFKGVSVFLGLMVTFGSSGLVNQIMSGFMVTYSRAVRSNDFVRIGDVEGTVTHLGVLSTKIMTLWHEEVTIPNAVVVGQTTTNYSRSHESGSVMTPTSVTIGYDAPWRQVQSLLLLAAEQTDGLRREPKPFVLQMALEDFYVKYTLFVCLESQPLRPYTLHALHAKVQDLFNEHGVQIMSPHYVLDPAAPKVVPKQNWFAAPSCPDPARPDR